MQLPFGCHGSTEFVVKASVPPYKARETLCGESVVREDKWITREALNHFWQGKSEAKVTLTVDSCGLPESALSFKS